MSETEPVHASDKKELDRVLVDLTSKHKLIGRVIGDYTPDSPVSPTNNTSHPLKTVEIIWDNQEDGNFPPGKQIVVDTRMIKQFNFG